MHAQSEGVSISTTGDIAGTFKIRSLEERTRLHGAVAHGRFLQLLARGAQLVLQPVAGCFQLVCRLRLLTDLTLRRTHPTELAKSVASLGRLQSGAGLILW